MSTKQPQSRKDSWSIVPGNTALVVIDMQRAFLDKGSPLEMVGARELVPGINKLAARCREYKIPVIWVRGARLPDLIDSGLILEMADHFAQPEGDLMPLEGKPGSEIFPEFVVSKKDYLVSKKRYSALIAGSSNLEPLLKGLHCNSIIICGVATDVCVGATTIDAMMLGYKVFFVGDLTTTWTKERQKMALEVYNRHFCKVMTLDEVIEELGRLKIQANVQ